MKEWLYCSYADYAGFRGAVFVKADGVINAALKVRLLGISPGGQMIAFPYPEESLPPEEYRNKLLLESDLEKLWPGEFKRLGDMKNESD